MNTFEGLEFPASLVVGLNSRRAGALVIAFGFAALAGCGSDSASDADADASIPAAPTAASPATSAAPTSSSSTTIEPAREPSMWFDVTDQAIGETALWTNKVDVADIDNDGDVDLLFANGGNYDVPGEPLMNQIFANDGNGVFEDVSEQVLGDQGDLARVIKARDINGDGLPDIIVGTTFETQSRLFLGRGGLTFEEVTDSNLPQIDASVGDLEIGDVDADGDLDIVLADWGPGKPRSSPGAAPMLWLNDGNGVFTDAGPARMPDHQIRFSWDLELVDIDNDFDLDILVSCKSCEGGFLYRNDGTGTFADASDGLPQRGNNYDYEAIDLNADGFLDLTTINDGKGLTEHVLLSDGLGGFTDETEELWPEVANVGEDDNAVVYLDIDSDGDADFLIGSLSGKDRVLINDGGGHLTLMDDLFGGAYTPGTLGIALADFNGDARLDVVQAQGEKGTEEKVFFGELISPDTAPPIITNVIEASGTIHARIHDNKSPTVPHDWQSVAVDGPDGQQQLEWYGEYLWRTTVTQPGTYRVCATDAAGNSACSDDLTVDGD